MSDYTQFGAKLGIPWRRWTQFNIATLKTTNADSLAWADNIDKLTSDHWSYGIIGQKHDGSKYLSWNSIFKPNESTFALVPGAAHIITYGVYFSLAELYKNVTQATKFFAQVDKMTDPQGGLAIDWAAITGKHYDGSNEWPNYPIRYGDIVDYGKVRTDTGLQCGTSEWTEDNSPTWAEIPLDFYVYNCSWNPAAYLFQDDLFNYGCVASCIKYYDSPNWGSIPINEEVQLSFMPQELRCYYFDPIVNNISPLNWKTGQNFTITGLGFDIPESTFDVYDWNETNHWDDRVFKVSFEGQQGQGTFDVNEAQYTVTNTTITIPAGNMPALTTGTYLIRLYKSNNEQGALYCNAYAGDWRTTAADEMYQGSRFIMTANIASIVKKTPIVFTKWGWKGHDGTIVFDRYSEIDVNSTDYFWDGRIVGMSNLSRSVGGKSGMGTVGDIDLDLANDDKYFSKMLATYFLKNQVVEFLYGYDGEPAGWAQEIYAGIVEDYTLTGNIFKVKIKDISQKFYKIKVPRYRCTEEEFSAIQENANGKVMPEILGLASYAATEASGAIEAVYVDTANWKFLAARASLKSILQVYKDGATLALGADYTITYEDGGRTYINLTADPGSSKITFNCQGYMYAPWNSVNGYVQNPARVLEFLLGFLCEIPQSRLDLGSFDTLASILDDQGASEAGFLALQAENDPAGVIAELLFDMGARGYHAKDGRYTVKKKDISTFTVGTTRLFTQIDLIDFPERSFNLKNAVNTIKAKFNYVPAANLYQGAFEKTLPKAISDFEADEESRIIPNFKWITDETFVEARATDELYRKGYGDQKINFSVPAKLLTDLELMDNIQLQDEFGISATGAGESGKYIYIESLAYEFSSDSIKITCDDLSYLLRRYFVLGDRAELADNWNVASDEDKTFAYLAVRATGEFANGEAGKILISRDEMDKI